MSDADMITVPETKAELAAEDAAFVKAFNETRAEDVAGTALAITPTWPAHSTEYFTPCPPVSAMTCSVASPWLASIKWVAPIS